MPPKEFFKTNWADVLGATALLGNPITYLASLGSVYWLTIEVVFCFFILIWGLVHRKSSSPRKVFAYLGIVFSVAGLGYFGLIGGIRLLATEPLPIGSVVKTETDSVKLLGTGTTRNASHQYALTFNEAADYVETEFTVGPEDRSRAPELNLFYHDQPQYKDTVIKSGTKIDVKDATTGFMLEVTLVAELTSPAPNPVIQVKINKRFAEQNSWWRFRSWVFERFRD